MAKVNSRNKKFEWDNYNLEEIRKEYYSLGMNRFTIKYHVGHVRVLEKLGYIPEDIKKLIVNTCQRTKRKQKLEILENTTKVARMYEKRMKELKAPVYQGPFAKFIKHETNTPTKSYTREVNTCTSERVDSTHSKRISL